MREILFRGKRKDNGEWVYGNYAYTDTFGGKHWIFQNKAFEHEVDENTVCQYTGLTDKNGNKIWENDIVRGNINGYKGVFVINWNDIECRFGFPTIARVKGNDYEVIGNIFDNADLLKGE